MITLITGAPGAGKSAALVDMLFEWAEKNRRIYVDGIPDLVVSHELMSDPRQWHVPGVCEDGSVIVFDEVQRLWRVAAAGSAVPPDIAALETHRHRGLDFYIVTQHPNLIHQNVRRLVGRHVHLRDLGILGRRWYEWPEAGDPLRFRTAPVQRSYKVPRRVLGAYKSASIHIKPVRSIPRSIWVVLVGVGLLGAAVWYGNGRLAELTGQKKPPAPAAVPPGGSLVVAPRVVAPVGRQLQAGPAVKDREPYAGLGLTLAASWVEGERRSTWFAVHTADGQRLGLVKDSELFVIGYAWRYFGPCAGVLIFGALERFVGCDAAVPLPAAPGRAPGAPGPVFAASAPRSV